MLEELRKKVDAMLEGSKNWEEAEKLIVPLVDGLSRETMDELTVVMYCETMIQMFEAIGRWNPELGNALAKLTWITVEMAWRPELCEITRQYMRDEVAKQNEDVPG